MRRSRQSLEGNGEMVDRWHPGGEDAEGGSMVKRKFQKHKYTAAGCKENQRDRAETCRLRRFVCAVRSVSFAMSCGEAAMGGQRERRRVGKHPGRTICAFYCRTGEKESEGRWKEIACK